MSTSILGSVQRRVLDNGLTILVNEDFSTPVVSCHAFVRVGSNFETDDVWGWSHGIEHMLFKGTDTRGVGDIAREVREVGGVLNAGTGYDMTSYFITAPAAGFAKAIELHADGLQRSAFRDEDLANERQVLTEELNMYADVPDGFGIAWDALMDVAFTKHRYRRSLIGTEATLRDTPREVIVDFYRRGYIAENIVYVVAGAVAADEAFATVEKHFGGMPKMKNTLTRPPVEPRQETFRFVEMTGDVEQGYVKMGFHIPDDEHPDSPALQVLGHLLGAGRSSRLYRELLERQGVVAAISVLDESGFDPGLLVIDAVTDPGREQVRDAVLATYREIGWFHDNLVSDEALAKSLNNVLVGFMSGLETVDGQSSLAGRFEAFGDYRRAGAYPDRIAGVSAHDVQKVARTYLRFDGSTVLYYLPGDKSAPSRDAEAAEEAWLRAELGDLATTPPELSDDGASPTTANPPSTTTTTDGGGVAGEVGQTSLQNGCDLLVRTTGKVPMVALAVYGPAGSRFESDALAGIGTLCSRTMLKGTKARTNDSIADELERYGISLSPFNDRDVIGFYLESLTSEFDRALDLFSDVIRNAAYPETELDRERELQLADLAMEQDDTFTVTIRTFTHALMNGHPYGRNALGTPESIAAISRDDLAAWHRSFFVPANLSLAAVGDIDLDRARTALNAAIGDMPPGTSPVSPTFAFDPGSTPEPIVLHRDKQQSVVVTGVPAPSRHHESRIAHQVLHRILDGMGERLFTAIREERQLCYATGAFYSGLDDAGMFGAYVGTSPERVDEALAAVWEELEKIRDHGPTEDELERAIRVMTGTYLISFQRSGTQASTFARNAAMGFDPERVLTYPDRVRQVTRDQVIEAARMTLDRSKAVTVILTADGVPA